MATLFDEEHKDKIGKTLTVKLAQALKDGRVNRAEASLIGTDILDNIDKITTHEQLMEYLTRLTSRWPIFSDILILEKGEIAEDATSSTVKQIATLIKENRLDEAIHAAKNAVSKT